MKTEFVRQLTDYIESYRSIFFVQHFDIFDIENIISRLQKSASGTQFFVKGFNPAVGQFSLKDGCVVKSLQASAADWGEQSGDNSDSSSAVPLNQPPHMALFNFLQENHDQEVQASLSVLEQIEDAKSSGESTADIKDKALILVLQDCSAYLEDPQITSMLKVMADATRFKDHYQVVVLLVSPTVVLPKALEEYITLLDIPAPSYDEISKIINNYAESQSISIDADTVNELSRTLKGLNAFQVRQILNLAYHNGGEITSRDQVLVLQEKAQVIRKSGILELMNFTDTLDDIGGLESLKDWLDVKSKIFKNFDRAMRAGVDVPKGVLIFGMPGCGKSLCAKATANKFGLPLVRLDVGRLLGKYVGESEQNMRKALSLAEAISPCVLWIDELEKAFAGVSNGSGSGGHEVTARLFGQFLTWMQEKDSSVFIVATANDISVLPTEFLRKGRFDEIFFVGLPKSEERNQIIKIHLKKRGKWHYKLNLNDLVQQTDGYSGADLETIVKDAIETAFIEDRDEISSQDLLESKEKIRSISETLADNISSLKEVYDKYAIRNASK